MSIFGFGEVDILQTNAHRYIIAMYAEKDLRGYWLHDTVQGCNIAVFASDPIKYFFDMVGYSDVAAEVMIRELERTVEGDNSGYTIFGKALLDYAEGLGIVETPPVRLDDPETITAVVKHKAKIIDPESDEAQLQDCVLKCLRREHSADLYVLRNVIRPKIYNDVQDAPRLTVRTR